MNLFEYPNERGTKCVDWGPDGLNVLILNLSYVTLRRGTICWQDTAGLVGRCREGDSLQTPIREQDVVGTAALAVLLPEGPVGVGTITISKLGR